MNPTFTNINPTKTSVNHLGVALRRLITVFGLCLFTNIASSTTEQVDELRWFEIEIIVFKQLRTNTSEELWGDVSTIDDTQHYTDFLSPLLYPEPEGWPKSEQQRANDPSDKMTRSTLPETLDRDGQTRSEPSPTPFELVDKERYTLDDIRISLSRSSIYRPLIHTAWIQPVKSRDQSEWVRLVGGDNFVNQFELTGEVKSDIDRDRTAQPDSYPLVASNYIPVPEVDGAIQVYLGRYLHLNTNLFLRIPGEYEVDISTVSSALIEPSFQDDLNINTNARQKPTFDWRFDTENLFDENASTKAKVPRLLSYPMRESRRIRSGEVHYFDHPLFGLIVEIRPFDSTEYQRNNVSINDQ